MHTFKLSEIEIAQLCIIKGHTPLGRPLRYLTQNIIEKLTNAFFLSLSFILGFQNKYNCICFTAIYTSYQKEGHFASKRRTAPQNEEQLGAMLCTWLGMVDSITQIQLFITGKDLFKCIQHWLQINPSTGHSTTFGDQDSTD